MQGFLCIVIRGEESRRWAASWSGVASCGRCRWTSANGTGGARSPRWDVLVVGHEPVNAVAVWKLGVRATCDALGKSACMGMARFGIEERAIPHNHVGEVARAN